MTKLIVVAGGTGRLGRLVVDSLLVHPAVRVRILSRDPAKVASSDRIEVAAYDDAAFAGAYAVVSTLQGGPDVIVETQLGLLRAAKAAGVRRFIASAYSFDFFALPEGINVNADWRRTFAERARAEAGGAIEVVHVLQGMFADRNTLRFLGLFDGTAVRYWGDGTTPLDWTTWEDTARFTAAAALDDRSVPERLFVSGDRASVLELASAWHAARGQALAIERLGSLEDLAAETKRRLAAEPANMYAWLPLMYARAVFGGQALLGPSHNDRYPAITAATVAQAIARGAFG